MLTRIIQRFPYLFWLTGLLIPALFVMFLFEIKNIWKTVITDHRLKYFFIFLCIQVFCLIIAPRHDFFTLGRGLASMHNIFSFSFIFLGFAIMVNEKTRSFLSRNILTIYFVISFLIIVSFLISLITKTEIIYPGLLASATENKFTMVRFNRGESSFLSFFPRSTVMGIYPNSTAFLMLILHTLLIGLRGKDLKKTILHFTFWILIFCILVTGSRLFLLFAIMLYSITFLKNKRDLSFFFFVLPFLLVGGYFVFEFLSQFRDGSNATRSILMVESLNFFWKEGPAFGVGIKPLDETVLHGLPYPIGSHSTIVGYFVKTGLFGGLFVLGMYFSGIWKWIKMYIDLMFTNLKFKRHDFYIINAFIVILLATIIEDIDAYALIPMYFGMLIYFFHNSLNSLNEG